MAYNNYGRSNREWDQGKAHGYEAYEEGSASRIRPREEDYGEYAGGEKRRKFQNGDWRGAPYANTNEGDNAWSGNTQYAEHNTSVESWQDDRQPRGAYPTQPQNQSQFSTQNRRRLVPSEPSPHVIFLGLDPDHTEADLHGHLLSLGCVLDNVTIIRDRATGLSKGFGFAQFSSTEHAKTFVTPRFPFISVPPPASHGASALQAYNLALEAGSAQNGRRVKIDFSQSAHPPERGGARGRGYQANDGTRDIGTTQSPVVLLRGLDFSSSPEAIAQGLRASAGPGRDGAKGMKRIILVKDKYSNASWGYAFAEFVDVQSSSALLADLMSPQLHPSGFRIAERPVAASFAHPYSFQPLAENMLRDESCVSSSLATGGVEDTWAKYWDDAATVAELAFEVETPAPLTTGERDSKPRKKKDTAKAFATEEAAPAEASSLPVSDKPVTLSFKGGVPAIKSNNMNFGSGPVKPVATATLGFTTDNPDAPNTEDDTNASTESGKATVFKKVAPLIASKKVASNISKWNNVQEELSSKAPSAAVSVSPTLDSTKVETSRATEATTPASSAPIPGVSEDDHTFADPKGLACLLCSRQFKLTEQLRRHNKESELHKKNFKDANLRQIAAQKASALKTTAQPKYRDRASERRVLHNQPDVPLPEHSSSAQRKQTDGPPPPPPPPPPPVHPGKDESNIGNKLLKKMGWAEGSGLGTDGDGRVDPIQTAIYAQGVGLGASKGKEIGKYADGYSGYVSAVRDSAKERYESH